MKYSLDICNFPEEISSLPHVNITKNMQLILKIKYLFKEKWQTWKKGEE